MKLSSLILILLVGAYAVMWIGGVAHYVLKGGPPLDAPWTASIFLLLAGILVTIFSKKRERIGLAIAALIGFIAEILGVRYGLIFSPYHYTDVLQPQLFNVPLVMLCAWMVLVSYARQMASTLNLPVRLEAVVAAVWMTAIDLVIDPLAANQLGYWRWVKSSAYYGIPWFNFVGWFIISLIIFSLIRQRWESNYRTQCVGLSIVLFFTVIALSSGMVLAGIIGLVLCLIHFAPGFRFR